MERTYLVSRISQRAWSRYKVRVTDVVFGDWLRDKLILAPPKKGRHREWNACHYRVALEICRLISQGVTFKGIIKWHLWIKRVPLPKFQPTENRQTLLRNFRRLSKLATENIHSTYDPRGSDKLSDWRATKIVRSMGCQDERLKSILPLDSSELIDARNLAQFDVGGNSISVASRLYFTRQVRATLPTLSDSQIENITTLVTNRIIALMGGVLGTPDEIEKSAQESISTADCGSFEVARNMTICLSDLMAMAAQTDAANSEGYKAVAYSAISPDWRIGNFVFCLHVIHRGGGQEFLPELMSEIHDIIVLSDT